MRRSILSLGLAATFLPVRYGAGNLLSTAKEFLPD